MATRIWIGTDTGNEGDYATAANWVTATVPEAGDAVVLQNSSQSITAGLDQSAIVLASFTVEQSYTGDIGTLTAGVVTYLQIASPIVDIGKFDGYASPAGSKQVFLDLGSGTAAVATVHNSANTATDTDVMPIQLLAANATTKLYVKKGKVGFANAVAGETGTIDTIDVSYVTNRVNDAQVSVGSGVTLENWNQTGGQNTLNCATTVSCNVLNGTLTTEGTGTHVVITVVGGTLTSNSTGTITLLNCQGGLSDFTKSNALRTVTTIDEWVGMTRKLDPAVVTLTNDPEPQEEMTTTTSAI